MALERINPDDVADPVGDLYSQVVVATGTKHVHVAGTTSRNRDGEVVGETMGEQTRRTLENVEKSLAAAGATPDDVVRNTIYATDADEFVESGYPEVIDFFGEESLPASALIGVDHLAHPDYLMEMEITAVLEE
ncbi:MAG: RidA family protein [Salinigranum sp.]